MTPVYTAAKRAETIKTSLGQQVDVTVTGFDDSPLRFDQLIEAISGAEGLIGVPYPSHEVTMMRESQVSGGFCGINQMSYASRFATDPYVIDGSIISIRVDEDCFNTFDTIAHEVAHTWFHESGYANWIDEGLANAIELQVVAANQPYEVAYPPLTYCESYRNIRELEQGNPARISKDPYTGFGCNYSLGDGIFGALKDHYGVMEFNKRIAQLARRETNSSDRQYSIADIRRVFGGNDSSLELVNLWYQGQPETRNYRHLDAVKWTFPPTIDGEYLHFAGKLDQSGVVHDFNLGEDAYCSQFSLYEGIGEVDWVNNVSRPLPAGWTHDPDSKVITINHSIDPNTGEFKVTAIIVGIALSNKTVLSLLIRERVATGADGLCQEGTNYAQIPVIVGRIPTEQKQARYYHSDAVEWTFPPTIDGEYLHFAGITSEPGMVHDFVLGDDNSCSQFTIYRNYFDQDRVATLSDPLSVGWTHVEIPSVVIINNQINPDTGEFSVSARLNDPQVAQVPELSLVVQSRVALGQDRICDQGNSYSQIAVSKGDIPSEFKVAKHYHANAIQWTDPPALDGATLTFAGKTEPGVISLRYRDGYCGQFSLFERDERGYHRVASLAPLLPDDREWTSPQAAELVEGWTYTDGKFNATTKLSPDLLSQFPNPVLVVRSLAAVDPATRVCGESEILSAIDIQRN